MSHPARRPAGRPLSRLLAAASVAIALLGGPALDAPQPGGADLAILAAPGWREAAMTTVTEQAPLRTAPRPETAPAAVDGLELHRAVTGTDPTSPELLAGAEQLEPFLLIGFSWRGPDDPTARFRVHTGAGWTAWRPVTRERDHGPDPTGSVDPVDPVDPAGAITSDPTWVGEADGWELGLADGAADVQVHLVRARPTDRNGTEGGDGFSPQRNGIPADAAPAAGTPVDAGETALGTARLQGERPAIATRAAWGARPAKDETWTATSLRLAVVHHTGSGESSTYAAADVPAMLRAVQAYHQDANGWNDIGYNLVVDRFGRIWEGRQGGIDTLTVGAHASGMNTGSVGVVVLGDFRSAAPSTAALDGLTQVLAWKLFRHGADPTATGTMLPRSTELFAAGQPVTLPRIVGHQDVNSTGCPGSIEQYLPQLRAAVTARYQAMVGQALLGDASMGGTGSAGPGGRAQPLVGDFDKDGRDDVFWYGPGAAADALWIANGAYGFRPLAQTVTEDGTATRLDWSGDGAADVLISEPGRATVRLLQGVPAAAGGGMTATTLSASGDAVPVVGDFDGDGDEEVYFYDPATRKATLFSYDNGTGPSTTIDVPGGPYRPAVGDFDGDLRDDIVWYAPGPAADAVWYSRAGGAWEHRGVDAGGDFLPLVADLNGDQRDDILWRPAGGGQIPLWWGGATLTPAAADFGPADRLVAADVDGGGSADVVAVRQSGSASVWLRQGDAQRLGRQDAVPPGAVAVPADFDGDGRRELWWWVPGSTAQDGALWRAV